ncbi:DUF6435 family protein [Planctomycetaceae bacterium]|jgi:hypothetical protein|nr:DUF6435 family protein [Planctomycetaceae bacterium]
MFGFFKTNPVKNLEKQYAKKLEEARDQQRYGDVVAASRLTAEAEEILAEIEQLEALRTQGQG